MSHAFCFHEPVLTGSGVNLDVLALSSLILPVLQVELFDFHVLNETESQTDGITCLESRSQ